MNNNCNFTLCGWCSTEPWIDQYRHSPGAELAAVPNAGVELVCCPKTGAALGLAPKVGAWEFEAVKGDPKDEPNEGVWLAPNPADVAELNTNGGAADGAVSEEIIKQVSRLIFKCLTAYGKAQNRHHVHAFVCSWSRHIPEVEAAEGAAAPKPKDRAGPAAAAAGTGAGTGAAPDAAPKMKG